MGGLTFVVVFLLLAASFLDRMYPGNGGPSLGISVLAIIASFICLMAVAIWLAWWAFRRSPVDNQKEQRGFMILPPKDNSK